MTTSEDSHRFADRQRSLSPGPRILVAQPTSLGDLVLTTPLLGHLRDAMPDASIVVLVRKGLDELLSGNPDINSLLEYDSATDDRGLIGLQKIVSRLRAQQFTHALILPGSMRIALATALAAIPRRIGTNMSSGILLFRNQIRFRSELLHSPNAPVTLRLERLWKVVGGKHSIVSPLFTDVVVLDPKRSAIRRHLQLLEPLGIQEDPRRLRPRLFPGQEDRRKVGEALGRSNGSRIIALAPGARWLTKRWPAQCYAELALSCVRRGFHILILGTNEEHSLAEKVSAGLPDGSCTIATGQFSALQTAEAIRRCAVLVTNDSAPLHLAVAMATPAVALFGPTVPEFGFVSDPMLQKVVERRDLWCRPCTPHGGDRCPIGTHECMVSVPVRRVLEEVEYFVSQNSNR
jgi:heptosyltransferase-2